MKKHQPSDTGRRSFLKTTGHLMIGFNLLPLAFCQTKGATNEIPAYPGIPLRPHVDGKLVDSWIRLDAEGFLTVLSGKQELGQGIKIALIQIAAEELDISPDRCRIINSDTGQTANEGFTAGSNSVEGSGKAIRNAAAEARRYLLAMAAEKWSTSPDSLSVTNGTIKSPKGDEISYWKLLEGKHLEGTVTGTAPTKAPRDYRYVGQSLQRDDIRKMALGEPHFVHDLRMPGMLHARVLHPPSYHAKLESLAPTAVESMPGVVKVIRDGSFLAVVAEREYQAVKAREMLKSLAVWSEVPLRPLPRELAESMTTSLGKVEEVQMSPGIAETIKSSTISLQAEYFRPYHMHASMGPSCAIALWEEELLSVWTATQGVYPIRATLADLFSLDEEKIRCIGVPGSGCYGQNGADDVSGEAALIAKKLPGRPIRLQWMRESEHQWEPYGTAMAFRLAAGMDAEGKILAWDTTLWSDSHSTRPNGRAGSFVSARHLDTPFEFRKGGFSAGSYRNGIPEYSIPAKQLQLYNFAGPLRTSSLRGLGAYANTFAMESFLDELIHRAGKDPIEFRLENLEDPRARAVLEKLAEKADWKSRQKTALNGFGIAYSRYKNSTSYFAALAEVDIDKANQTYRLKKLTGVIDSGLVINPDGLRNQCEGGMIQSASWSMLEEVRYDGNGIISENWSSYPILRMMDVPEVEVHLIDRPDTPPMGAGEAAMGPVAAAIANAIFDATGSRIRDLPLKAEKIAWNTL
ncbi:xanthine dehydrogenase family protein molybdopterin-binding subunit [Algoriphagus sp. H41]|uniref:Xanthine dehydrogenase family protein molybdopterin-binding subunit n=1 Tax=Algoriphagus oliviformis TaxID=2811231 RepID=A0ABS3C581_9BACT|nr:molybdopterin cofactor-binding domain-containing protein [Algoriphagus oliviformis]MBN7812278.1 xanthine dehydrogenase family protein molybdopterin-binding subunit [Algoriphagus oliviformis]